MTAAPNSLVVGDYVLAERIGAGRLSRVYRATGPGGEVALKILAPDAEQDDPAAVARFRHEVSALAAVNHVNVVKLIDHGIDPELGPYLVMPLLGGTSLRAWIGRGRVEPSVAVVALRDLAAGLAALHRAGIVHRDLKPENIIIGADGQPMIIDLGLAWAEAQTRHTEEGAIAGSVPYMAPEQIERAPLSPATDLWALAVIAHEWIAGERPFARSRPSEEVAAILAGRFEPLATRDRRVDPDLGALLDRGLRPDPGDGGLSADELARELAPHAARGGHELLRDVTDSSRRIAGERAAEHLERARRFLARGKAFEAAQSIERAAAHRPDDPAVLAMAGDVGRAPVRSRGRSRWLVLAGAVAAVTAAAAIAIVVGREPIEPRLPELRAADLPVKVAADERGLAALEIPRHERLFALDPFDPGSGLLTTTPASEAAASLDPAVHEKHARGVLSTTRRAEGVAFLDASLVKLPDAANLWTLRGYVSLHTNALDRAETDLSRAIELAPDAARAHALRGELRRLRGQLRGAFVDLSRAHELDADDLDAISGLVRIHDAVGRDDAAQGMARRATELAPEKARPFVDLALVSDDATALEHLERAIRNEPFAAEPRRRFCFLSVRQNDPRAEKQCLAASAHSLRDPDIALAQARLWEQRGDVEKARMHVFSATVSIPDDLRLWLKLIDYDERLGNDYALDKERAAACALGHQPMCQTSTDSAGTP